MNAPTSFAQTSPEHARDIQEDAADLAAVIPWLPGPPLRPRRGLTGQDLEWITRASEAARSPGTHKIYQYAWEQWATWCAERGFEPLPADPAEEVGYDVAYVYDHLTHPTAEGKWLADGFTTLGAAAVLTERIGLGTLVASATLHSPVSLARRAGTVQDVSGGRLVLGLGAGSPRCSAADRGEDPTPREMFGRLRDVVVGMQAVWDGATEWTAETWSFRGLQTTPLSRDARRPFLTLAAHGPKALALAAEHADGWNTYGGPAAVDLEPEAYWAEIARQCSRMDLACEQRDRPLHRSLLLGYGTVRPTASVEAYGKRRTPRRDARLRRAGRLRPRLAGDRFHSDAETHAAALSEIRAV